MSTKIVVPPLGESVVEATVARWLKQEGDPVSVGEPVVQLETEKVDLDVSADKAGVLARIERREGEDVQIGDVLGIIEEAAAGARPAAPAPGGEQAAPEPGEQRREEAPQEIKERVTPVARRIAEEHGVDLAQVQGTGPDGRVTKQDVEEYMKRLERQAVTGPLPAPAPAPEPAPPARVEPREIPAARPAPAVTAAPDRATREQRVRMSRRRQTIARRLVEAQQTAAMLTTFNEIDMSAVIDVRKRRRESFKERHNVGLGFMSFFVKATIGALKAFPLVNAEIQGDEIVIKHYYDIGIAVGASEGLVVPVLRDADRMSFAEIERQIKELARKAEEGTLSLEELRGGTFTITNGGVFGSLLSTPILNPPQVGILGMHKIEERPVVVNGQIVVRPMMYVALSYDHRIIDGREAVQFLVKIKELVEDPEALLLEG
ncbi:MAG: dihydrolipoyllysine-residue succinyltransferase component of 2-oxoglutarate dehydrogenase complex [Herpetosiphonaceae bacterium]|nr:MAG: dihydrolipoyllysine-residue succinyltransferase component of 2-oxoglutarate dehydrogenase complex [Herpetosiphonaceae bacterium]